MSFGLLDRQNKLFEYVVSDFLHSKRLINELKKLFTV